MNATNPEKETPMDATKTPKLTPNSLALFTAYAKDAGNWSGTPLVGGNVRGSQELRGNLTQVKRAGLVETFRDEGNTWLTFTDAGIVFAASLGIDMRWIRDLGKNSSPPGAGFPPPPWAPGPIRPDPPGNPA